MMTERLLQFIWQFQYYNKGELVSAEGEPLIILHPGVLNQHQGPDFLHAKIMVGTETWAGNVELHLNALDWNRHGHESDPNYSNIILHVVWSNERLVSFRNIPTLVLEDRVSKLLLGKYTRWMEGGGFIPCSQQAGGCDELLWSKWKETLLVERLIRKFEMLLPLLEESRYYWDGVFWLQLARNFGLLVNADAFEQIARSLPLRVIARHKNQLFQLECLLLGQAGLLGGEGRIAIDDIGRRRKEYLFYRKKYGLSGIDVPVFYLRMRPASFPHNRLRQLAEWLHDNDLSFSVLLESGNPAVLRKRYPDAVLINAVAPLLFAYGKCHANQALIDRSIALLIAVGAENNAVVKGFRALGVHVKNAFDSQALIELKTRYCDATRCLDCAVGQRLLRPGM